MPAASTPGGALVAGLKLAIKAASAYTPRNEGDRSEHEMISSYLGDLLRHAEMLDELADGYERQQRINAAQDELRQAQSA